jgi:sterol desaturase/sphingolipid hydroxylase (fatty acid hydroxylase superfamily)
MDWMAAIGDSWLTALGWLAGLALAFGVMARLMPCNPGMYWWKDLRAAGTDFMYWFVVPLFLRVGRTLMLIAGVVLLFGGRAPQFLPVQDRPLWQQCLAILLIQDVMLYGIHRAFHSRLAWKFHAIHHSPTVLDWMSTSRTHPVNHLLEFALADVVVLLMGFAPAALVALVPFNMIYSAMVHANLNWTFGPLRHVFASPVFHRWHHTTREEGLDKNFASTFSFLDVIFGTFHMPPGRLPEQFGTGDADFPEDFWGQFVHPFRKKNPQPSRPPQPAGTTWRVLQWARHRSTPAALVAVSVVAVVGLLGRHDPCRRQCLTLTGHTGAVLSVAGSADGQRIVSGGEDGTVKVWDAATGQEQLTLTGHTRAVLSVAVSADGHCVVSGSADGQVKVWDATTGQEQLTLKGGTGAALSVGVSADGRRIVSAGGGTAKVWDAQTGREELTLTGHTDLVYSVAISPDGGHVVSGSFDERVKVWDVTTGREQLTLTGHVGPVYSVAISPDGQRIVSGGKDQTMKVWDAATGRETLTLQGHTDSVTGVAVSADGRCIVSGSRDGTMKVWDALQCERGTVQAAR